MRLFTEKQVNISAFLAGPIAPGLFIYHNYKALGKKKQAIVALASTLLFTVAFIYGLLQIPREILDKIPGFVFTAFYGLLVLIFYRAFLAKDVKEAMESGARRNSNWTVAGITVIGLLITLAILFRLAIEQPFFKGKVAEVNGNEMYYDESVPIEDVRKLIDQFKTNEFFGDNYGNIARLQHINNEYHVTMVVDEKLWDDQEIISSLTSLKWLMEIEFGKATRLKLESISLSGTSKNKEL